MSAANWQSGETSVTRDCIYSTADHWTGQISYTPLNPNPRTENSQRRNWLSVPADGKITFTQQNAVRNCDTTAPSSAYYYRRVIYRNSNKRTHKITMEQEILCNQKFRQKYHPAINGIGDKKLKNTSTNQPLLFSSDKNGTDVISAGTRFSQKQRVTKIEVTASKTVTVVAVSAGIDGTCFNFEWSKKNSQLITFLNGYYLPGGGLEPGRPIRTWQDTLKEDFETMGVDHGGVDWSDARDNERYCQRSCQMETTRRPMFHLEREELSLSLNIYHRLIWSIPLYGCRR